MGDGAFPIPKFTRSSGVPSALDVETTEQRLGIEFPSDYKEFLRATNGGCPEPDSFMVPERGPALVAVLYGIKHERVPADLEYEKDQAELWDPLPAGMLVIGHDPGGNSIVMKTIGKDRGHVFFWDRNGLWVRDDGRNLFPVAASFGAFLESLREVI